LSRTGYSLPEVLFSHVFLKNQTFTRIAESLLANLLVKGPALVHNLG